MENCDEKLRKLTTQLLAEKESKRKLKRKLKLKMAQKVLKMKEKLRHEKQKFRQLKKNSNAKMAMEQAIGEITDAEYHYGDQEAIHSNIDIQSNPQQEMEVVSHENEGISATVPNFQRVENANEGVTAKEVNAFDIRFFHSYAMPYDKKPVRMYRCSNCSFETTKKDTLDKHEAAFCILEPVLDMKCFICEKLFTYDGLRGHLRYFATSKHSAKNSHAKYSPEDHQMLLEQLKQQKK